MIKLLSSSARCASSQSQSLHVAAGEETRTLSPVPSADQGLDDPICLNERGYAACPQCSELRLKNQELRRIATQKSQLHHDGILLMSSMQKGHNDAIGVLHERIKSLEEQVAACSREPIDSTLEHLQAELSLKTNENLELAAAFEELEGEEQEVVSTLSTLKRQLELQERQLCQSREEASRHEVAAQLATEAHEQAKHDIADLAKWLLECEAELASLHKILAMQEDLLILTQQHLPAERWPYFIGQMEAIQKEEKRCAAIGRKGVKAPSGRGRGGGLGGGGASGGGRGVRGGVQKGGEPQTPGGAAACRASLEETEDVARDPADRPGIAGGGGGGTRAPRDDVAATGAGEWQVRLEANTCARNPWPPSPPSPQPPSPIPPTTPPRSRGRVASEGEGEGEGSESEQRIDSKKSSPGNHIEPLYVPQTWHTPPLPPPP